MHPPVDADEDSGLQGVFKTAPSISVPISRVLVDVRVQCTICESSTSTVDLDIGMNLRTLVFGAKE